MRASARYGPDVDASVARHAQPLDRRHFPAEQPDG